MVGNNHHTARNANVYRFWVIRYHTCHIHKTIKLWDHIHYTYRIVRIISLWAIPLTSALNRGWAYIRIYASYTYFELKRRVGL